MLWKYKRLCWPEGQGEGTEGQGKTKEKVDCIREDVEAAGVMEGDAQD